LYEVLEVMRPLAPVKRFLEIGGGSRSGLWRDITGATLGVPLYKPAFAEGPARGAALLAWVGAGGYKTVAAALKATAPTAEAIPIKKQKNTDLVQQYRRAVGATRMFKG
jgi:xylulokinase